MYQTLICEIFIKLSVLIQEKPHTHYKRVYSSKNVAAEELTADYWNSQAQETLKDHLKVKYNTNTAKNVILFLGDGMSIPTLTATRLVLGGEKEKLSFEKFPFVGLSKTYCVDAQTADSACSATAYLCGVKTNDATIGVTAKVKRGDCNAMADKNNHVKSIAHWAQQAGKAAGFVTTTRVTHASPAGTYASTADRDWESDADVVKDGADPKLCPDIAEQLMKHEPGKHFKVKTLLKYNS